jgi:hypothetical protein
MKRKGYMKERMGRDKARSGKREETRKNIITGPVPSGLKKNGKEKKLQKIKGGSY